MSLFISRLLSNDKNNQPIIKSKYDTEDVPPIPPYQGYPGDDFTKGPERIKKVEGLFKYG